MRNKSNKQVRIESCKALIKPEIVPPFHGYSIPKPHVRAFVEDHIDKRKSVCKRRDLISIEKLLVEGNKTNIFHGAPVALGNENLIVLSELIWKNKKFGVFFEAVLKSRKHFVGSIS